MIRAAALSVLLLSAGAQAGECGDLAVFQGTWLTENSYATIFGPGSVGYQRPDMEEPGFLTIKPLHEDLDLDEVSLDCETLDKAGIARQVVKWGDYLSTSRDREDGAADLASAKALLGHPPYMLLTARFYESVSYYIRVGKEELISVDMGEGRLSLTRYKRKV